MQTNVVTVMSAHLARVSNINFAPVKLEPVLQIQAPQVPLVGREEVEDMRPASHPCTASYGLTPDGNKHINQFFCQK